MAWCDAKRKIKKIIGIVLPITAFVFLGFEHSIANMFFIPIGLGVSDVETAKSVELFLKILSLLRQVIS